VGFNNPSWSWSELEATLSGRRGRDGRAPGSLSWNAGGDSPAWGRKRQTFEAPLTRVPGTVPYAELHCHSNYSFLDGASHPEELATEAARLGLEALALTDHDGFYGVVRFAEAARAGDVLLVTKTGRERDLRPEHRGAPTVVELLEQEPAELGIGGKLDAVVVELVGQSLQPARGRRMLGHLGSVSTSSGRPNALLHAVRRDRGGRSTIVPHLSR
jgi:error-prone DNA polymerase